MSIFSRIRMINALLLGFSFVSHNLLAISESNYRSEYQNTVIPFWNQGEESKLDIGQGAWLSYKIFPSSKALGDIVVLQGWTEPKEKYAETAFDLNQAGYSVYLFDWRGQGHSSRLLADSQKSYITDYKFYIEDLQLFVERVVRARTNAPLIAMAHSMGANILSLFCLEFPNSFERIVLASPMLEMRTDPLPERMAWVVAKGAEFLGQGDAFAFGQGHTTKTDVNIVTNSLIRRSTWVEHKNQQSEAIVSGATYSWIRSSLEATWKMKENAHKLKLPILMLQAGNDLYVKTEGQNLVCERAVNCQKLTFPGAKHEILNEIDEVRNQVFQEIFRFFGDKSAIK